MWHIWTCVFREWANHESLGLVESVENVVYGSIVQIPGLKDWTDEQIVDLAFQAHLGMLDKYRIESKDYDQNFPNLADDFPRTRPKVTSTIVIDNTAYISSSVVGGYYVYKNQNPRPNAYWYNLNVARFDQTDPQHPCKQGMFSQPPHAQPMHVHSLTWLADEGIHSCESLAELPIGPPQQ